MRWTRAGPADPVAKPAGRVRGAGAALQHPERSDTFPYAL
ncbi:hypothetical protein EMIT0111MI5_10354 [Burkholderia sp. IT-111MI5]